LRRRAAQDLHALAPLLQQAILLFHATLVCSGLLSWRK
jgi:hypothetical protein